MENDIQKIVILKYCSKSIEILLPNNYNDLIKIFVAKFQIEKNKEDLLQITYNDDENDNIIIFSEEDFEVFKKLIKENLIKNELIGNLSKNSLQNIDNDFNIKLDNLLKDIIENPINNNNLQNDKNIENSFNSLKESDNEDKKEIIIKDNNKLELNSQKQLKDIIIYNSEINKDNSEIKMLMEENMKQKIKLEELERKMSEQKDSYENQIKQINLENQKLKEENQKNETKLDEYSKIILEKEKSYNNFIENNEKKENEDDNNRKLLEEKTILLKKNEEEKKKIINEFSNKNKELIDIIKEKENKIKEYILNQKKEEEKLNQLIKKNKNYNDQIGKLKKELEEYKNKINEINNKNKNIIIDNNNTNNNNRIVNQNIVKDQQSEEYKKDLEYIKTKYNTELNKKIKEILKTKFDNNIYNEINKQSEIILNNYLQNLEDFEKKRKENFSQKKNNKNKDLNVPINEAIHEGIKCEKCLMKPIMGERYKCSICPDYNLCKKCEEENFNTLKHKHNFIKIRYENIENISKKIVKKEINLNNSNERKSDTDKNNNEKYSFIIENIQKKYLIYCETKKYEIILKIKNNSNFEYPEQTQIIYNEKKSTLEPTNKIIKIKALMPNKSQNIKLVYDNLESKKSGNYYSFLNFEINGNKIDEIKINIKILENNDFELVEIFKNTINIYSFKSDNNAIIKALKKNSYNFEKTFSYLLEKEDKKSKI